MNKIKLEDVIKDITDPIEIEMISKVNLMDFQKCVLAWSGLDEVNIAQYLKLWAKNKKSFYINLFKGELRIDKIISIKKDKELTSCSLLQYAEKYPAYAPWLSIFDNQYQAGNVFTTKDKMVREAFPTKYKNFQDMKVTKFFQSYLQAPEELVTDLGKYYGEGALEGTYTVSIDPVDMILASVSGYEWTSCYRITSGDDGKGRGQHSDGAIAALIDTTSLITYLWRKEGKIDLDKYKVETRYKIARQYVNFKEEEKCMHFCKVYPGDSLSTRRSFRIVFEEIVSKAYEIEDDWKILGFSEEYRIETERFFLYGYDEFGHDAIVHKTLTPKDIVRIEPYDERIPCPCGCLEDLVGSEESGTILEVDDGWHCGTVYYGIDWEDEYEEDEYEYE